MTSPKDEKSLTAQTLRSILDYNSQTGIFTWRFRSSNRLRSGDRAGSIGKFRYERICINRRSFSAHRLAWLHYYGEWPTGYLDHINGNYSDNRICNLRLATHSQNLFNVPAMKNNKTELKGISFDSSHNKWVARISAHGKRYLLGRFDNPRDAHNAYKIAAIKLHGEFARF